MPNLDQQVHDWAIDHRTAFLDTVMEGVTRLGSFWVAVALVALTAMVVFARTRDRRLAAVPVIATSSAASVNFLVKQLVDRSRPPLVDRLVHAVGPSFPSGHAASSAALWGSVALLAPRLVPARWVRPLQLGVLAVAGVVGLSRVYLGVHWPTDVLAGWLLGGTVAVGVFKVTTRRDPLTKK